jgi:hypothetical protein
MLPDRLDRSGVGEEGAWRRPLLLMPLPTTLVAVGAAGVRLLHPR